MTEDTEDTEDSLREIGGKGRAEIVLAARDGFQAGQTAKAQLGPPCAVTPTLGTWPPVVSAV